MSGSFVNVDRQDRVLVVTIDRVERRNALHSPAHFEMSQIFDEFEVDEALRVAIVTGAGDKAFCAGNDLKFQAEGGTLERPPTGFAGLTKRFGRTKPVIAAVNGVAFGGGFEIVLACDIVVAAQNARFCFPEVARGLVPLAGVHSLPRQIPHKIAMGLLLTGAEIDAQEASALGIVNEVCESNRALTAALGWAARMLEGSPEAIRATLDMVERGLQATSVEAAMTADYESLTRLRASHDFLEGPLAFAEKRKPRWQ